MKTSNTSAFDPETLRKSLTLLLVKAPRGSGGPISRAETLALAAWIDANRPSIDRLRTVAGDEVMRAVLEIRASNGI